MSRSSDDCPVCGVRHPGKKCNKRRLAAIDAANTRAANDELEGEASIYERRFRTESVRMHEGFEIMNMRGDDE